MGMTEFEDNGDLVPGTDDGDPGDPSSAGTENTDKGAPGPVPYHRFKEVNERLRDYADVGSADDFRRLMEWEQNFGEDPAGWWLQFATQIDGLPDVVKQAVEAYNRGDSSMTTPPTPNPEPGQGGSASATEPPQWAKDLIAKVEDIDQDISTRREKEAEESRKVLIQSMHDTWLEEDKKAKVKSPPIEIRAALLSAASAAPSVKSREEAVALARSAAEKWRQELIEEALEAGKTGQGAPRSVPGSGSGSGGGNLPEPPKTLEQAKKAALAYLTGN